MRGPIRWRRLGGWLLEPRHGARAKGRALGWVARSRLRTRLWYLPRRAYVREQQALLAGIAAYHEAEADRTTGPVYRLRRNVHRIEKGLAAPDPRPVFAEGYIEETVAALVAVAEGRVPGGDPVRDPTLAWASDVLEVYFARVTPTAVVDRARARFEAVVPMLRHDGTRVPRPKDAGPCPVDFEAMLGMAKRRRSVRAFRPEPVPRDVIDAAVEVARQSPSACNRQAFEFRVFDEPALVQDLVDLAPGFDDMGRKVPVMVAVVGKYRAYYRERDMHVIYVDASLATMALVFALESLGYASCCINWPSLPERDAAIGRWMGLQPDEEVVMLLAIGRADDEVSAPFSDKVALDVVRTYNRR